MASFEQTFSRSDNVPKKSMSTDWKTRAITERRSNCATLARGTSWTQLRAAVGQIGANALFPWSPEAPKAAKLLVGSNAQNAMSGGASAGLREDHDAAHA